MSDPFIQRVIDEKNGLDVKLEALNKFIAENPIFLTLDPIDQIYLQQQSVAMGLYSTILGIRIARHG